MNVKVTLSFCLFVTTSWLNSLTKLDEIWKEISLHNEKYITVTCSQNAFHLHIKYITIKKYHNKEQVSFVNHIMCTLLHIQGGA